MLAEHELVSLTTATPKLVFDVTANWQHSPPFSLCRGRPGSPECDTADAQVSPRFFWIALNTFKTKNESKSLKTTCFFWFWTFWDTVYIQKPTKMKAIRWKIHDAMSYLDRKTFFKTLPISLLGFQKPSIMLTSSGFLESFGQLRNIRTLGIFVDFLHMLMYCTICFLCIS